MFSKTNTCSTRKRQEVFSFVRNSRLVVGKIQNFNTLTNFFVCVLHTASLAFTRSSKSTIWYTRIWYILCRFPNLKFNIVTTMYYPLHDTVKCCLRCVGFRHVHCTMLYEVANQWTYKTNIDSNLLWLYHILKKKFWIFFLSKNLFGKTITI